jgi:hypothetical protein
MNRPCVTICSSPIRCDPPVIVRFIYTPCLLIRAWGVSISVGNLIGSGFTKGVKLSKKFTITQNYPFGLYMSCTGDNQAVSPWWCKLVARVAEAAGNFAAHCCWKMGAYTCWDTLGLWLNSLRPLMYWHPYKRPNALGDIPDKDGFYKCRINL